MIQLRVAEGSRPTGRTLAQMLRERGVSVGERGDAVVNYGVRYTGSGPALNALAGSRTKLQELRDLRAGGVRVPNFFAVGETYRAADVHFPLLARTLQHREGRDIMLVLQQEDIAARRAAGAQFFTEYIPRQTEYRIWVYRGRHKATYQKVLRHPQQYKHVGCSHRNGFAFELVTSENVPRPAVDAATQAIDVLGLDFGAVDVLHGKDGNFYVLEVNTAPGVEGPGRQGISALADSIAKWANGGYKSRRESVRGRAVRSA